MSIEQRLASAREKQDSFIPNDEVAHQLSDTTLGALIGVTGVGKSHLIPHIINRGGHDFSEVGNISTRAKRGSDPNNFRGSQPIPVLLDRIEVGDVTQYMVHPSGDIYASDAESYATNYVLLPILTTALKQLQNANSFKRIIPIGIVTDGATWDERLGDNRNIIARMQEALICLTWLRNHIDKYPILENKTGEEELTAQIIVDIMRDPSDPHPLDNIERIDEILKEMVAVAAKQMRRLTARN